MADLAGGQYDAVIIGAGIGGLVCGCYLAKAGMKVLIAEQHSRPGGYCTSFRRQGFTFDAGPHCFGSYREGGVTRKIARELGIEDRLNVVRPDPTDILITPGYEVPFRRDLDSTIGEFRTRFPAEKKTAGFFHALLDTDPASFSRMRSLSFRELLDRYFDNEDLKLILSYPLLGIAGLPSSRVSAFVGAKLFSEFLLDGGYYPVGGMQVLSDSLAQLFSEHGGDLLLSGLVTGISVNDRAVTGIEIKDRGFIQSKYVISDCDAKQTFLRLINRDCVDPEFIHRLEGMTVSLSNFIAYLGLDSTFSSSQKPGTTYSVLCHNDLQRAYQAASAGDITGYGGYMFRVSHDSSVMIVIIPTACRDRQYWQENKYSLLESVINAVEEHSVPGLKRHIVFREAATPHTLQRYTLNDSGSSFGWAGLSSQFGVPGLRKPPFVRNLYLTGHWSTLGSGISGTAYVGSDTARMILRKEKH